MSNVVSPRPDQPLHTFLKYWGLAALSACALKIAFSDEGIEMLCAAAKTTVLAALGAAGGGVIGYLAGAGSDPLSEENASKHALRVSIGASLLAITNTVISITDSGTMSQQTGAAPVAGLTAGLSGFFIGRSYAAFRKKTTGIEAEDRDLAIAGLGSALLTSAACFLAGASASIVGTLTACSCIGSAVHAYKANQNSQRSAAQSI